MVTIGALVLTQEPTGWPLAAAIVATAVGAGSLASLALLRIAGGGRERGARAARRRAVRRGLEIGAVLGLVAALQVVGGLTPLTALFVALSFAIAEYVLSAGGATSR